MLAKVFGVGGKRSIEGRQLPVELTDVDVTEMAKNDDAG